MPQMVCLTCPFQDKEEEGGEAGFDALTQEGALLGDAPGDDL